MLYFYAVQLLFDFSWDCLCQTSSTTIMINKQHVLDIDVGMSLLTSLLWVCLKGSLPSPNRLEDFSKILLCYISIYKYVLHTSGE